MRKQTKIKKGIINVMKELKERTNDVSEFEHSMTTMQFEMKDVKENMNKVAEVITKLA